MSKTKKNQPRPRWVCKRCGVLWVSCSHTCIVCGGVGTALNDSAEKIIQKRSEDDEKSTALYFAAQRT